MNKEYFKKYYKDHKEKIVEYAKDYRKKNRDRISESKRKPGEKPARVIGIRMKGPKPFLERISPELLAKIKGNTRINDKKIKYFTLDDTENAVLVRNLK